jgi:hypothetical protein
MGADDEIVIDANRHRLRVAEAVCGRMATATGVVVIQAADNVKPEQAAEIGPLPIDRSAQFVSKPGLDLTSEPVCCQDTGQLGVEPLAAIGPESYGKTPQNTRYEYCYDFKSQWFRQKSGGDSAVRSECVITGMIFHHSRVKSELLHK